MLDFITSPFVIASLGIISIILLVALISLQKHRRSAANNIEDLNRLINDLSLEDIHIKHHDVSVHIQKSFKDKHIYKVWREFEESLVIKYDSIENTLDAYHFFNEDALCPAIFTNDQYQNASNYLVAIGVLFTFIGLVTGLSALDVQSDDIETLKAGIESIVNGAATAFISSIAGITASLFFSFVYGSTKNNLRNKIRTLQNSVDFKYPRTNPEKSLAEIREYSKETEIHLGALSEKLGDKLQEVVRDIGQEIKQGVVDSLSSTIGPYMEQITSKAMNSSETAFERIVEEFLEKVGKAGEEQQKLIQETNEAIQEALIDFRNDFTSQVEGLREAINNLNSSYHFLETELVGKFDLVVKELSTAISSYSESQANLNQQINSQLEVSNKLNIMTEKNENLLSEIRSLISEFNDQISASIQAYNTATNNLETIYEANTSASELLRETVENIEEPFALLQQEYESMRAQMETTIERMSDKMNDVLNAYFTQVQQQTTERMREWNNQTTQFSSAMVDVTNELNILVEKLQRNVKQV